MGMETLVNEKAGWRSPIVSCMYAMATESTSLEVPLSGLAEKTGESGHCRPQFLNHGRFLGGLAGFQSIKKLKRTIAHKRRANPARPRLVVEAQDN